MNQIQKSLSFTERMAGHATIINQELKLDLSPDQFLKYEESDEKVSSEFTLTIKVDDLIKFINDPNLLATAIGEIELNHRELNLFNGYSKNKFKVEKGEFNLFVRPEASVLIDTEKEMHYTLYFKNEKGEPMTFFGFKTLTKENGIKVWQETTTLYFYVWKGHSPFVANHKKFIERVGVLHISPLDFINQLTTFKTNSDSKSDLFEAMKLFFGEFAENIWESYAPFIFTTTTSRWREHLIPLHTTIGVRKGLKSIVPFETDDGLGLSLSHFKVSDNKNVVLLLHGLTTSTDMFIMPEHYNLVNYLHDHGFTDVWSLDWRGSERHTYNLMPHRYTMDDVALYDIPKAVDVIRGRVGKDANIHIICHCVGSISTFLSLASGKLKGIKSVISNSVSLTPSVKWQSKLKLTFGPDLLEHVFGYAYLSPRMPYFPGPGFGKWIYWMERLLRRECKEPSCHMISFMWGWGFPAAYQHENLHPTTHRRLHDLFGGTSFHYYRHIRKMLKNNEAVPFKKEGPFLDFPDSYLENVKATNLPPTLFISGDKNNIFPGSNKLTYQKLKKIIPNSKIEFHEFKNYGHQDTLMGQNAHIDIFPKLLSFLKQNSQEI